MTPEQLILPLLHREAIVLTSTKRRWHYPLCWKSWTFYGANYVGILQHCARERGPDDQTRNLAERLSRCSRQRLGLGAFKKH